MRTVKTTSGATAVQVVWSSRRGSREIEHHSPIVAARELRCHEDTVLYRLRVIEDAPGRPVDSDPLHIGLALRALGGSADCR